MTLAFSFGTGSLAFFILTAITLLFAGWIIINIFENLKLEIYLDENGVWLSGGIFPWNKGTSGSNWRDISEASYRATFLSWLLKSYTIRIRHRYTQSSEMVLSNIRHGDKLVQEINQKIQSLNLY